MYIYIFLVSKKKNYVYIDIGERQINYPDKAIMEMHSNERGCEWRGIVDVVMDKVFNNFLGFWAALGIEIQLQLSLSWL